jgi:hypothetical protein
VEEANASRSRACDRRVSSRDYYSYSSHLLRKLRLYHMPIPIHLHSSNAFQSS